MTSKTLKKKEKLIKLPSRCICGSNRGRIAIDNEDGDSLFVLLCRCGIELDHSMHKHLLGKKL